MTIKNIYISSPETLQALISFGFKYNGDFSVFNHKFLTIEDTDSHRCVVPYIEDELNEDILKTIYFVNIDGDYDIFENKKTFRDMLKNIKSELRKHNKKITEIYTNKNTQLDLLDISQVQYNLLHNHKVDFSAFSKMKESLLEEDGDLLNKDILRFLTSHIRAVISDLTKRKQLICSYLNMEDC